MHTLIGLHVRHTLNKCYLQVLRRKRYAENSVKIRPVDVEIIGPTEIVKEKSRAYSKRVPRTNCALRIKKCAPRISSGIYFLSTS